jgi:hypothetical protein
MNYHAAIAQLQKAVDPVKKQRLEKEVHKFKSKLDLRAANNNLLVNEQQRSFLEHQIQALTGKIQELSDQDGLSCATSSSSLLGPSASPSTSSSPSDISSSTLTSFSDASSSTVPFKFDIATIPSASTSKVHLELEAQVALGQQYEQQLRDTISELTQLRENFRRLDCFRAHLEKLINNERVAFNKREELAEAGFQVKETALEKKLGDHKKEMDAQKDAICRKFGIAKKKMIDDHKIALDAANSLVEAEKNEKARVTDEATHKISELEAQLQEAQSRSQSADSDLSTLRKNASVEIQQLKERARAEMEKLRQNAGIEIERLKQQVTAAEAAKLTAETNSTRLTTEALAANASRDAALAEVDRLNADAAAKADERTAGLQIAETSRINTEVRLSAFQEQLLSASQRIGVDADNFFAESCEVVGSLRRENTALKAERASLQDSWDAEKASLATTHQAEIQALQARNASLENEKAVLVSAHEAEIQNQHATQNASFEEQKALLVSSHEDEIRALQADHEAILAEKQESNNLLAS